MAIVDWAQTFAERIVLLAVMPRASVIREALAQSSPTIPSVHSTSAVRSMGKLLQTPYSRLQANSTSYCGTTKDFCGKKTVNRPSCSAKGSPMRRVVGYYEGWATTRSCDRFSPSDIPDGVYTHINFAFASINPKTFEIEPASSKDPALYRELTRKKKIDPKLKVFIAIGGWAFNDPGPTVTTFSDIARSETNQRTFIKSLVSFMATYGFDGVDIDWEYPAADDRQGREEDFVNLPKFLNNIKSALRQSGDRNGLSIAIPASYWYLQHFDLAKISKHVDHFNVMTYDFHGAWDTPKSWLGNHLNSHTNLTEIKDAFDLLWRNKIDPDQVNMGLAFYARTFSVSNPSCMSPGCLFDAGGPAEPCTDAVGVMSNPEIMRKLGGKSGQGNLDKTAAVKTLKFGSTWLTYDDVDTWKLKLDFARSQCLGGAMVWAISQDTSDGKFSKQLQLATGYKSKAVTTFNSSIALGGGVFKETTENEASIDVPSDQCRWSNCGKSCPNGWFAVQRKDPWRRSSKERMQDSTGCGGNGLRLFCCPRGEEPFCQWIALNRGNCNPGCPDANMVEVGSYKGGCGNGKAQVACCRGSTPALDVYRQYKWYGKENDCATELGSKACGWSSTFNTLLTFSQDGSGAQKCWDSKGKRGPRPICGDESDSSKAHFTNCQWTDNFDLGLTDIADREQCNGNCPEGKIKVALEENKEMCKHGTVAYCCDAESTIPRKDIDKSDLLDALKAWVKRPTCPKVTDNEGLLTRSTDVGAVSASDQLASLVRRAGAPLPSAEVAKFTLQNILEHAPNSPDTREDRKIWDEAFAARWQHVTAANLAGMWNPLKGEVSTGLASVNTLCHMNEWEDEMEDDGTSSSSPLLCPLKRLRLLDPSIIEDPDDAAEEILGPELSQDLDDVIEEWSWPLKWGLGFERRGIGKARPFKTKCPDNTVFTIMSEEYINGDNGGALAKANNDDDKFFVNNNGGKCGSSKVDDNGDEDDEDWVSEHIMELQTIRNFIEFSMGVKSALKQRTTPSDIKVKAPFNPARPEELATCSMWKDAFLNGFPAWTKAGNANTPKVELYTMLGSVTDPSDMVNCQKELNGYKAKIWKFNEPVGYALRHIHIQLQVIGVWQYLNNDKVIEKLANVHIAVTDFLDEFEKLYRIQYPKTGPMGLSDIHWRSFISDHFENMLSFTREWTENRLRGLKKDWTKHLNDLNQELQRTKSGTTRAAQLTSEITTAKEILNDTYFNTSKN
ncbi:hypothetical protein FGADI_8539 [Fusarium gaditjirri]|uniref:chitinase n=1 Tax=Fusarium gaditjirri TaxID=282569 RepID=A0A8H4WTA0_9HYPO|nr:hypothetical protein FGADI_8539 [Fusarium gaditjirri]